MERRNFLSWLFYKMPLGILAVLNLFRCEREPDSPDEPLLKDASDKSSSQKQFPDSDSGGSLSDNFSKPVSDSTPIKISILEDLEKKLGDKAKIEIIHSEEDGDPYVKSISSLGSDCLYFTVNGKPYLGGEIHVESVLIDPKKDAVQWYCQGQLLQI